MPNESPKQTTDLGTRFCAWVDTLSEPELLLLSEHVANIRRGTIEECIDHLRINGWFEAAEKCLGDRYRRELYGQHDV